MHHNSLPSPPQPLEPCRVGRRVHDGVLNIPMSQVVLYQPRVGALVGQGEAARMAQHVRVRVNGQACELAIMADHHPGGLATEWAASFADKESVRLRLHLRADRQPGLDSLELVTS